MYKIKIIKSIKVLVLGWVMLLAFSCGDILTEEPPSFVTVENFFQNEADARAAVIAIYTYLYRGPSEFLPSIWGTDVAFDRRGNNSLANYNTPWNPSMGAISTMWNQAWLGIATANSAINNIPNVPEDPAVLDPLIGEARFLRAYYYFYLAQYFGDLPIVTEPATSLDEIFAGQVRQPVADVYNNVIIPDLIAATGSLSVSYDDTNKGRATVDAANALLAKVYAVRKQWSDVVTATEAVISGGRYDLLADYADLWRGSAGEFQTYANKDGQQVEEKIFDVQFKTNQRGTQTHTQFGDLNSRGNGFTQPEGGWSNVLPTFDWFNSFDPADERLAKSFFLENADNGGPTWNFGRELGPDETPNTADDESRPYIVKYLDPGVVQVRNNGNVNTNLLRYADVLLLRAEAENELTGPDAAYPFINAVRERAGLAGLSGLDQASFKDAIVDERAWELGMEGLRRWDLLRWGLLGEKINGITDDPDYLAYIQAFGFQDHYVLFPIPQDAIDASRGNLEQNFGYE